MHVFQYIKQVFSLILCPTYCNTSGVLDPTKYSGYAQWVPVLTFWTPTPEIVAKAPTIIPLSDTPRGKRG